MIAPRLGVLILPEYPGPRGTEVWQRVEQMGAHHAWTYDHLSWRATARRPWFDAMTTLAAAACATDRIGLGILVASPNLRHPVTTAAAAMTIDQVSGGRFVLGIGSGAAGPDTVALGEPALSGADQAGRFAEFVRLTDTTLRGEAVDFRGRYYAATSVRLAPGCVQQPRVPFAIAAAGRRGMRLAVELGEFWVTIGRPDAPGTQPEAEAFRTLRSQLGQLTAVCEDIGRAPTTLRTLVNLSRIVVDPYSSVERLHDLTGRCAQLGFTDVVLAYPRQQGIFAGDHTAFEKAMAACQT